MDSIEHEEISNLLTDAKTIAIVGVSDKADRPSNEVARYLMDHSSYDLYFVNPNITQLFGRPAYSSLKEITDLGIDIDIVDVFRKVSDMPEILEEAISVKAKAFWMQLGLRDDALKVIADEGGVQFIQDKCIKIEFQRLQKI